MKTMKYKYSIIEHAADIKLKITASTKEGLFRGSLEGMAWIMVEDEDIEKESIEKRIEISALEENILLVDFLSEVLAQSDIYNSVFPEIEIEEFTEQKIIGKIKGKRIKRFKEEIKAVTYHGANICKNKQGFWEITILFDI